ncbi:YjbH domain-containing protein [Ramlibacter sp. G-1-2-2]|uniref:YjbH domain-containing protein n=1 Tax=Ramlibacter agri TaxID=2728837 RepID=A0A848H2G1_9BURK|nr:YjbH domain-containing protein [Ramlibacter agri]NML43761.1 YjbH domain-containing protein [Ramlibacter agri]
MNPNKHHVFALTAALVSCSASAVDTTMTQAGYTGLGITPNARLLDWGRFEFAYDNQLPGAQPSTHGSNYVAGFGMFPNFEFSGRLAANSNPDNCFVNVCHGVRDLSASGKFAIGIDARNRFRLGLGATDVGGAATNFRSYYGVLTFDAGSYEASAGLAKRSTSGGNRPRSPLDGPFASAAWQPLPWVRGQLEYTDGSSFAGVRLFAPKQWLPEGWSAYIGANLALNDTKFTERNWWSAGVSIPLYKVPSLPAAGAQAPAPALADAQKPLPVYEARTLPAPAAPTPNGGASVPAQRAAEPLPPAQPIGNERLEALAQALRAKGLEDISVGRMADGSIAIRANNATYNWNSADAIGAALGAVARELGDDRVAYRLVITQRQLPLVAVTGQADCLRQWIQGTNTCAGGELSTPGTMALDRLEEGANWVVSGLQPSWKTLRISLSPVLRTTVGTEVGVLDYSAGINVGFRQPLWPGADFEWRVQQELAHSNDFGSGGLLESRAIRNGTERLAFTQTVRVPLERWFAPGDDLAIRRWGLAAVTAQGTVGRVGNHFDGVYGALRWEPGDGRHRVNLQGGVFDNADYHAVPNEPKSARPLLLGYRYNVAPTRTYLEATGGQFMNNDRGLQLGVRQWFSDVAVQLYWRRTQVSSLTRSFAGIEFSIPIGPRKDMNPSELQLTGTPRFSHAVESLIGGSNNAVVTGRGVQPPTPTLEAMHNSDRASLLYFEDNIRRIRDAAR